MGGFRSFFIESKLFQLVVEEGGNFFSLKIFERGKSFMQSVFMGKSAALWLMRSLEHIVIGVNPKEFFTFREGDTAYTLQRGSNSFGQYLSVTELKVGGLRRNIIIPAGKFQQGWRTFGIELRRRLDPSQYALGGLNFVPFKSKQIPKYRAAKSFVEAVKAPVQVRSKPAQQPFLKDKVKDGVMEKRMEVPRDNPSTQVGFLPLAVVDGKGGEGDMNGNNIFEAEISVGNNLSFPLKFNSNSNIAEFGKVLNFRKSRWFGRGLTVDVNEFGKRRVFWNGVKRGKQAGNWVVKESFNAQNMTSGLGPSNQNAQGPLLGSKNSVLGLGLSSPSSFEVGESSFSGPTVLEPSDQNCLSIPSPGKSDLYATKKLESSVVSSKTSVEPAMLPSRVAQPSTVPTGPAAVAHTSHEQISVIDASSEPIKLPAVPLDMVSSMMVLEAAGVDGVGGPRRQNQSSSLLVKPAGVAQVSSEPVSVSEMVNLTFQEVTEGRDVDLVGSEGLVTTNNDSVPEGVHLPGTTIRDLVGDLDKSWGNSKDWMLQLRDGRQLVLPLSLYRSPDCMSVCSSMEEVCVSGIAAIDNEGQRVSWADEGEELLESSYVVSGSENVTCEFDERLISWERGGEPLVVVPLATEGPLEPVSSPVKEIGCKESVDNSQLSQWVINRIKAFKKSVGTSLEGFEEQITGLLLAIEAR